MRLAFISVVLAALLGGCSSGPSAPTLESGTMVVRPLGDWTYGATPRFALAEQYQFAGELAEGWLEPMQQAVSRELNGKGWQSAPLDEADLWVAIGVAGGKDMSDGEIFARLGMTPGVYASANERKGSLAIVLIDRNTGKAVWSSIIQLTSDTSIADSQRQLLSQQLAAELLHRVPNH
ncbi:DUF4136 domain-containing protein [Aeromonas australiensis]|uniref:DUF4136 domain-containing protein n=1 Tax=Aeromonas australiensis TaxID=1114880 RepID=UPI000589F3E2|nr:DUF4136 domain-containing protein [Aeromonas australiensis]